MIACEFKQDKRMALAISQAENGTRQCDRVSKPNKNGTVDYGVFQINTVHTKRISVEDLKDCRKNIEFAYKLFKEQGNWSAWSVFNNQAYKRYLK